MRMIRPQKRHVLSVEEAIAEAEITPVSENRGCTVHKNGVIRLYTPWKGVVYSVNWFDVGEKLSKRTSGGRRMAGQYPSLWLYTATVRELAKLGGHGKPLADLLRSDFDQGHMATTTAVYERSIMHGTEDCPWKGEPMDLDNLNNQRLLFGHDCLEEVDNAYEQVFGRRISLYADSPGSMLIGKHPDNRRYLQCIVSDKPSRARKIAWKHESD
ncbi:hypothetical protein ACFL0V_01375 [Nanoarchaeota archaeon]